jgi:hypothetical protein
MRVALVDDVEFVDKSDRKSMLCIELLLEMVLVLVLVPVDLLMLMVDQEKIFDLESFASKRAATVW